jgi:dCMP deaminase
MDWDSYFLSIADAVSKKSNCLSIKRGCIIVKDKQILSTGYNGPPAGYPHCDDEEYRRELLHLMDRVMKEEDIDKCPRKVAGFKSGQGTAYCSASHAETNAIVSAAKYGISVRGATIYCNFKEIPCRECAKLIVNAGITNVILNGTPVDYPQDGILGRKILGMCNIEVVGGKNGREC